MSFRMLTVEMMPADCQQALGLVTASCCISKSLVGDMAANVKNWSIGGELPGYTALMDQSLEVVRDRLAEQAQAMGAKAVIGVRFSSTQVSQGAVELIIYGTAVC